MSLGFLDGVAQGTSDGSRSDSLEANAPRSAESSRVVPMGSVNRSPEPSSVSSGPDLVRKSNPFEDVPSLYDMYVQAVARPRAAV